MGCFRHMGAITGAEIVPGKDSENIRLTMVMMSTSVFFVCAKSVKVQPSEHSVPFHMIAGEPEQVWIAPRNGQPCEGRSTGRHQSERFVGGGRHRDVKWENGIIVLLLTSPCVKNASKKEYEQHWNFLFLHSEPAQVRRVSSLPNEAPQPPNVGTEKRIRAELVPFFLGLYSTFFLSSAA
nr:PREDICTED: uncharacterized protein LOC108951864 [Musa acuminata subsp. malaccensis]XP_018676725.1 PREDICTED: uncharacterized protein LOC108951864 [Musa acuminata subsp. malaccensis]